MRFKAQVEGATTDFETRKEHDQQLDRVLADLCMPGATSKLSTGQQRVPIQLKRQELNPIARGWHELSIHSLIPSSNRSEILVIRAILIHCIMNGEDVRAEEIIADKMQEEWNQQGYLETSNTSNKTMKMRTNQCLKLKKEMKKDKEKSMTTNTISQNMTTNKTSNINHNFSNLHSMKSQPTQTSMKRTCIV
ncbi:hypothetical protein PIB30_085259 [Stylosanthes scabra]|uniref:Putative plant transposon protein domain-containing protein n=1 Tax=Stylosanthes scabra TaxID=79078 RepID=A0ABU6TUQ8_9FABA|nr:hypothetical protein [Stylosanthes scabra]